MSRPSLHLRPTKPADCPLFPHASGQWAKKVNGRVKYFGAWADLAAALAKYEEFKAGPEAVLPGAITLGEAVNRYLDVKDAAVQAGVLQGVSFRDYQRTCKMVVEYFGRYKPVQDLTPTDFTAYKAHLGGSRNINTVGNEIVRVRVLFKWIWDQRLIPVPLHFGQDFKKPSNRALRRHKRERGKMLFSREQILTLLDEAGTHFRAMILLGINCGFGNNDCCQLPITAVDLDAGVIDFPRPKTEVDRICPLWPETVEALSKSLARRPNPRRESAARRFFVYYDGKPLDESCVSVAKQFSKIRRAVLIKEGSFYWLRHTHRTQADGARDVVAANAIMGHVDNSMAARYREEVDLDRLRAVSDHVRTWLFAN